jgi:hypothetical protein
MSFFVSLASLSLPIRLAVLSDRGALGRALPPHPVGLDALDPALGSVGDGKIAVERDVRPGSDFDPDLGLVCVGFLLLLKCSDVALAGAVGEVSDPCFFCFTLPGRPRSPAWSIRRPLMLFAPRPQYVG